LVGGTVYLNEGGVCGSCPTAPPVAPACDVVAECVVHVDLESRDKISTIFRWKMAYHHNIIAPGCQTTPGY
jgi:hypothetical protein